MTALLLWRGYYVWIFLRFIPEDSVYIEVGVFCLTNSILMEMYDCAISIADVNICFKIQACGCENWYKFSKSNYILSISIFLLRCFSFLFHVYYKNDLQFV